ncbi:DUF3165 family protein [Streptococcus caviae]|uniref:DUF3165 family protein n=1 Tax=Streptococcus sp. 'caviae' TaxID=1915004 RepID=UPI00094B9AA0|nr:DUF3165 family protein [Streptococcus sp. 'caviae']OLN84041.1 hypothetical protein BMI76_02250 [Streptococcus sp. 'caviae']
MFYAIIAILLLMYYIFIAPKTVKNTMNMISVVAVVAFLMVLAGMTFIRIMQSPPEIFVGIGMIAVGYCALKDVLQLTVRPKNKKNHN